MNGESVTDLILRAIAAMRERGELPELDTPQITVVQLTNTPTRSFQANIGQALAAAQTGDQPRQSAQSLASVVAEYLSEVVDLVPAYHDVESVRSTNDGSLIVTLRGAQSK